MKSSMIRTLKTRQIGMVTHFHLISGTATTPADSGIDKAFTLSVVDNGTGTWTINLKALSRQNMHVVGLVPVTPDRVLSISAVDKSSVTVLAHNLSGAAADADFYITLVHASQLNYNF